LNVFDLFAKLSLDTSEYEKGLKGAKKEADSFGSKIVSGLGSAGKAAATATVAAVGAAATGIAALTKEAVSSYAEYEQLAGGVATLFGDSAQKVMQDASRAFNDAGMSMNQYMETSIQSAAALINSLGGDQAKAAELMNMSIIDMSDKMSVRVKRIELYQRCA